MAVKFMEHVRGAERAELMFDVAYSACKRAARGEIEPSCAQTVFEAWARSVGFLFGGRAPLARHRRTGKAPPLNIGTPGG